MASVAVTPTSGNITAVVTAVRVTCADVPNNTDTGYDPDNYPASPQVTYYFEFSKAGEDSLRSPVFSTNPDGSAEWNDVLIPAAGTWSLDVRKTSDDSSVANASVVVN